MTKKEQSRKKITKECEKMFGDKPNLILEWVTGSGKSFNAINLQHKMNSQKTFICVAEIAHIQNWIDEYIKHGYEELLKTTEIFCYASAKKYVNQSCDLLIYDEGHHAFGDIRFEIFSTIKPKATILLSATIEDDDKYNYKRLHGDYNLYEISMEKAIEMELIPEPKVILMPLTLDNNEITETVNYTRGKNINEIHCNYNQRNAYIYNKSKHKTLNLIIHCTQQEKYNYIEEEYNKYKRLAGLRLNYKFKWLRLGNERKRFLSDCKTNKIKEICETINNQRFICFCGSIEQADYIGKENAIHSKKESKSIIENFNNKKISSIFAVQKLVEGVNLTDIECAIVGQLDGQDRPIIQKIGRSIRAEFPIVYILYFKHTKDEDYLQNVIDNIPLKYIEIK